MRFRRRIGLVGRRIVGRIVGLNGVGGRGGANGARLRLPTGSRQRPAAVGRGRREQPRLARDSRPLGQQGATGCLSPKRTESGISAAPGWPVTWLTQSAICL